MSFLNWLSIYLLLLYLSFLIRFKESYCTVDYVNKNTCQHYQKKDSQYDSSISIALFKVFSSLAKAEPAEKFSDHLYQKIHRFMIL